MAQEPTVLQGSGRSERLVCKTDMISCVVSYSYTCRLSHVTMPVVTVCMWMWLGHLKAILLRRLRIWPARGWDQILTSPSRYIHSSWGRGGCMWSLFHVYRTLGSFVLCVSREKGTLCDYNTCSVHRILVVVCQLFLYSPVYHGSPAHLY